MLRQRLLSAGRAVCARSSGSNSRGGCSGIACNRQYRGRAQPLAACNTRVCMYWKMCWADLITSSAGRQPCRHITRQADEPTASQPASHAPVSMAASSVAASSAALCSGTRTRSWLTGALMPRHSKLLVAAACAVCASAARLASLLCTPQHTCAQAATVWRDAASVSQPSQQCCASELYLPVHPHRMQQVPT